jgi:hypothetical protein
MYEIHHLLSTVVAAIPLHVAICSADSDSHTPEGHTVSFVFQKQWQYYEVYIHACDI